MNFPAFLALAVFFYDFLYHDGFLYSSLYVYGLFDLFCDVNGLLYFNLSGYVNWFLDLYFFCDVDWLGVLEHLDLLLYQYWHFLDFHFDLIFSAKQSLNFFNSALQHVHKSILTSPQSQNLPYLFHTSLIGIKLVFKYDDRVAELCDLLLQQVDKIRLLFLVLGCSREKDFVGLWARTWGIMHLRGFRIWFMGYYNTNLNIFYYLLPSNNITIS